MTRAPRFLLQSALSLALAACAGDEDADPPGARLDAGLESDAALSSFDANSATADAAQNMEAGASDAAQPATDTGLASDAARSDAASPGPGADAGSLPRFSFFVTSLSAMRQVSGNRNGFGGDLRHGETGDGAGLRGADKICAEVAELGMPGASAKQWRAFLSTSTVNARTRIGSGPWYDRMGRLVAENLSALLQERPQGMDPAIRDDFPNERGEPNRAGSSENGLDDNHDVVTATNASGDYDGSNTCADWTSTTAVVSGGGGPMGMNGPRVGHSWPARSGTNWMAAHRAPGCAPSVSLMQTGGGSGSGIGNGGGYGGIYCFALTP